MKASSKSSTNSADTQKMIAHYEALKKKINHNNFLYYTKDKPEITDYEYDQLFNELLKLEAEIPDLDTSDSPTQKVGGKILEGFQKQTHKMPMLSLSNSYSVEDLVEFDKRIKKNLGITHDIEYICEPKLDGLSIEVIYEKGYLTSALTRGDGYVGEVVTENVKTIKTLPLKLKQKPDLLEVRGEILLFKEHFLELNQYQEENGSSPFANPRNAAAGSIRQLDSKIAASRPLQIFTYATGLYEKINFETQEEILNQFSNLGLPTILTFKDFDLFKKCQNIEEACEYYNSIQSIRHKLPFEIDGIVVKVNSLKLQDELGMIARSPRWATAAKFAPEQAQTTIEDIQVQVGRTGALTPVAILKPVKVGGVTISNATLHNQDEINRKDIRITDTVVIQRAGDVIPEVVNVVLEKRKTDAKPFLIPTHCPVCHLETHKNPDEAITRCTNLFCTAIIKESIKHFVSRKAMNMDKIGDRLIETLVDQKLILKFSDLYKLTYEDLIALERQGEKSVSNILSSIEKSKITTLDKLIYALGIRFVGEQTAKALAKNFKTLDSFLNATEEQLLDIRDVGDKIVESLVVILKNENFFKEVKSLQKILHIEEKAANASAVLAGKTFLITGTLPIKRDEAKDMIESNGGKIISAVSKKLDYLIAGEEAGSKLDKAQELGLKIISWEEFLKLF